MIAEHDGLGEDKECVVWPQHRLSFGIVSEGVLGLCRKFDVMSKLIGPSMLETWNRCDLLLSDTTVDPTEAVVIEKADQLASRKTITDVLSAGFLPTRPATDVLSQGRNPAEEDVAKGADKNLNILRDET